MESDLSPNPMPIKRHPFHMSLELLEHLPIDVNSPPKPANDNDLFTSEESCNTLSANIPNVIVTDEEGEILSEKLSNETGKTSTTTTCSMNPLSQASAKQIKYQTKAMYERSVSWIKKIKLILKDSPLMLFGLASKQIPTKQDIVEQSKIIFEDYLYIRLREAGFGFASSHESNQSLHSSILGGKELNGLKVTSSSSSSKMNPKPILDAWQRGNGEDYEQWHAEFVEQLSAVTLELHNIGMKLETTYPLLYKNVPSQVCISAIKNEAYCRRIVVSLGDMMFKNGVVTWARIAAMFSLASAVAVECCHHKEPRLNETVMSSLSDVMEKHAAKWIMEQGGWTDITRAYREMNQETRTLWALLGIGASVGFAFMWVTSQQW